MTGLYYIIAGAIFAIILLSAGAHYDLVTPVLFILVIGIAVLLYYLIQDTETRIVIPDAYAAGDVL